MTVVSSGVRRVGREAGGTSRRWVMESLGSHVKF